MTLLKPLPRWEEVGDPARIGAIDSGDSSPAAAPALRQDHQPAAESGAAKPDISVLQVGNRPPITAHVDAVGLTKPKQVLEQYEAILKLLK